jgi:hypothetical protein
MLRALMAALAFAGVARADESLPAPKGAGVAMQGPFADLDKLCASVACPDLETRVCPLDGDDVKQARTALGEVRLQPINCRAEGIRDGSLTYRFAVRRAEGWWLSSPLFTVGGNDKICAGAVDDLR